MPLRPYVVGTALGLYVCVGAIGCPTPMPTLPEAAGTQGDNSDTSGGSSSISNTSTHGQTSDTTRGPVADSSGPGTISTSSSDGPDSSSSGGAPVCALERGGCDPSDGGWWDRDWAYRRQIFITAPVAGPLTDVVLPVRLDSAFEFECVLPSTDDLRFISPEGIELAYEVDEWSPGAHGIVWVRLPWLDSRGASIWMYYGNDGAQAAPQAEVWEPDLGYRAVLHFGEDLDDARAEHHGEPAVPGESFFVDDGMLGHAVHFEDILVNRRVELMGSDAIDDAIIASEALTVSAWVRADPNVASTSPFKVVAGRGGSFWAMSIHDAIDAFDFLPPAEASFFTHCALPLLECDPSVNFAGNHVLDGTEPLVEDDVLSVWHHIAVVFETLDSGEHQKRVYVDGQLDAEFVGVLPLPLDEMALHDAPITIGAGPNSETAVFHGEIDELHMITEPWTSDQIETEYELSREPGGAPDWVLSGDPQCR